MCDVTVAIRVVSRYSLPEAESKLLCNFSQLLHPKTTIIAATRRSRKCFSFQSDT